MFFFFFFCLQPPPVCEEKQQKQQESAMDELKGILVKWLFFLSASLQWCGYCVKTAAVKGERSHDRDKLKSLESTDFSQLYLCEIFNKISMSLRQQEHVKKSYFFTAFVTITFDSVILTLIVNSSGRDHQDYDCNYKSLRTVTILLSSIIYPYSLFIVC